MRFIALVISLSGLLLVMPGCQQIVKQEDVKSSDNAASVIQIHKLSNGLKILVQENHRAPVVVSQVWYKVGGSYEYDGITGVSHALEHMMFKGTEKYPAGQFSEIIAANGGSENAFTGKDYTAYFQRIASDRLELCLKLEADRMRNLILDEGEFKKEIEVIKEERRMRTDDDPVSLTYERFNAVAYLNSSYHQPIIGWMEDLNTMTIDDLSQWYKTWYAPNNATLVVSGDVKAEKVFQLAEKYFGQFEASDIPPVKSRIEVNQQGERRITIKTPAEVPYLMMGYKVPVLKTVEEPWEAYALEVLAGVLDGGDSSRITRNLVRGQEIASQAGAGYDLYNRQSSLFLFDGTPSDKGSMKKLEAALIAEIDKIVKQKPADDELDRVKAQVMSSSVYEQDSIFYQAMQLGILETNNIGWQKKQEYLKNIQAVTAEQVQAVAKKYLVQDKLTVAVLEPMAIVNKKKPKSMGGARHGH
ncbi:MAG: insulinase family protein [Gammaproteobacteria bacterium]|nr:insulinase family protein [Gammaproteobacteria bacterium]